MNVPQPYTLIPEHRWTSFADVEVGYLFGSQGRTITEYDVYFGMGAGGGPVHVDIEYIKEHTGFKERLMPGPIILYYAICLLSFTGVYTNIVVAFGGLDKVRSHAPVFTGDTIRAYSRVKSKRVTSRPSLGTIVFEIEVFKQDDTRVMTFDYTLMARVDDKREKAASD